MEPTIILANDNKEFAELGLVISEKEYHLIFRREIDLPRNHFTYDCATGTILINNQTGNEQDRNLFLKYLDLFLNNPNTIVLKQKK